MDTQKLIILGSGPAGLTAAIYAARAGLNPVIIDGPKPGGQLMGTSYVENWPGIKSILGPQLMKHMREHAEHFGTKIIEDEITSVNFTKAPFILQSANKKYVTNSLIIATGATPKQLGCPGEDTYWGKGVTTCAVCDGVFYKNKKVIIVGGGDTAMEDASFMTNFTDKITVIHILDRLTASQAMQEKVIKNKNIHILYESTVTEIHGDNNKVTGVTIENKKTGKSTKEATAAVFIAIGLNPNTLPFKGSLELTQQGYIVLKGLTQTSVTGVFAAGDVADARYRQAVTSAGTGCMAALDAERYLKE